MLDPTRKYSKYLSFKGLSRSQNLKWQNTADATGTTFNELTKGSSLFKLRYTGIPVGSTMGYFKMTWYISMRGQRAL